MRQKKGILYYTDARTSKLARSVELSCVLHLILFSVMLQPNSDLGHIKFVVSRSHIIRYAHPVEPL